MSDDLEESLQDDESKNNPYAPRFVKIKKGDRGFGFNVRGQVSEGGQLRSINGQLYPPLQMISAVLEGGPAHNCGVLIGDRILMVNEFNCEGADHRTVVDLIRRGENELTMVVISVTPSEARKLDGPSDMHGGTNVDYVDYSERRSIPITIPDYRQVEGEKYIVYNIHISGKFVCSRRYNEFSQLHNELKRHFSDYNFPRIPSKWPFSLNDQQLDSRRRGLEAYLDEVTAVRVIGESDTMEEFLKEDQKINTSNTASSHIPQQDQQSNSVEITIKLPDQSCVTIQASKKQTTTKIYEIVIKKIGLSDFSATFFALFEIMEGGFERKLELTEFPFSIYSKGMTKQSETTLLFRKWIFTISRELEMVDDEIAVNLLYSQAVEDIRKGLIKPKDKIQEIKEHIKSKNKTQMLEVVRQLHGYNNVIFPHCQCDARKDGHIILTINVKCLSLQACSEDGIVEDQEHIFNWDEIASWDADTEAMCFWYEYQKSGKKSRQVRIYSNYYKYMDMCAKRIKTELSWCKKDETGNPIVPDLNQLNITRDSPEVSVRSISADLQAGLDDGDL